MGSFMNEWDKNPGCLSGCLTVLVLSLLLVAVALVLVR